MGASDPDLDDLLGLAVDVAKRAAEVHRDGLGRRQIWDSKTSTADLVGDVDRESERVIVESIRRARPDDSILAEEGTNVAGSSRVRWVVDPLDGTVNFSRRFPMHAVSIGVEIDGRPAVGVVLDTARGRLFFAVTGRPASRDGKPIQASAHSELETAIVATGFSYLADRRARQAGALQTVLPRVADIRSMGSAALDLCAVACGEVDAYYEVGPAEWDLSAGRLIAERAGALVRVDEVQGQNVIVAAGPRLAGSLLGLLTEAGVLTATP